MPPSDEYRKTLAKSLPASFRREIAPCLAISYKVARRETAHFPRAQLRDLLGHYRRAVVQRNFAVLARKHRIAVTDEPNVTGSAYHVLVTGGNLVLTESAVESRGAMVREAIFRKSYAESNQGDFFKPRPQRTPDSKLYALVIHGPGGFVDRPTFARIMFPLPDLSDYVDDGIDLIHDYIADAAVARSEEERVEEEINVQLRKEFERRAREAE